MPRETPGESAGAATVLGWCSPQSSVPRQTVGHGARAAKYETGLTAAGEGRRGEVPRRSSTSPPQGLCFSSSLIYPPAGARWLARTGGLWGGFSDPAKLVWVRFAKKWARELAAATAPGDPPKPGGPVVRTAPRLARAAAVRNRRFLIYPPAGAPWVARPGGLWGRFSDRAKLVWVRFARSGLASSGRRRKPGRVRRAWRARLGATRATYPTPRPAYPAPRPPTLHPDSYARPNALSLTTYPTPRPPTLHPNSYTTTNALSLTTYAKPRPAYPTPYFLYYTLTAYFITIYFILKLLYYA
jgi:hypothetical protein